MPADGERQREPDGEGLNHVLEEQDQRDQRFHGTQEHDVAEASLACPRRLDVVVFEELGRGGMLHAGGNRRPQQMSSHDRRDSGGRPAARSRGER